MSESSGAAVRAEVELLVQLPSLQREPAMADPQRRDELLARIEAVGAQGALWMYEPSAEPTVDRLRRGAGLAIHPVVPNMRDFLRDASDDGLAGATVRRWAGASWSDRIRIALHQLSRVTRVLSKDFATGILILADIELSKFRPWGSTFALLDASVTDLALALDNERLIRGFLELAERVYGLRAGVATYNYETLVRHARSWGLKPSVVAAPFNARGYLMNPSRQVCEATARRDPEPLIATHVEVDGLVPPEVALDYLRELGIRRAVVDPLLWGDGPQDGP
jgi:hypothetical protein